MTDPKPTTLKQRVLRAGGWAVAGYGFSLAIRLGSNLVMTRLLAPDMFGVMAIATMVTVILTMLSDIGLSDNIVQSRRGDEPDFLDTAWMLQIVRGFGMWLVALLLSAALHFANLGGMLPDRTVYASPVLPLVVAVSSFSAVLLGFRSTRVATARREFDQRRLMLIELVGQVAALVVMIAIGAISPSVWALVAGGLVASLAGTVLSHTWMSGHANRLRWEKSALRELLGFGKWVFLSSAVTVLAVNGDRLLLGGVVEADVLGLYAIALLIVGTIEGGYSKLTLAVSLPALSEIARNNPARMREVYYKLRLPGDLLLLFMTGFLFAAGQLLIDLLYDPRYSAAGGMLEILALSLFAVRYGVAGYMYLAVGLPRYLAIVNVARFISLYALVPPLYYLGGTQAAIWGIALHSMSRVPLVHYFNARLGLNDFGREAIVLIALPIGWLCGHGVTMLRV